MYEQGDLGHFHTEFRDPHTDELVDPPVVRFKHETPGGVETTLIYGTDAALTKESVGRYLATVDLNAGGTWHFRWETTGAFQGAREFSRTVAASEFAP
jgi:hypothetical protein